MVIEVVSQGSFDASHHLKDHPGKCKFLHGHTWNYEVHIEGVINEETGMVIDFGMIDGVIDQLDHTHLNDILGSDNPTSERVALWIKSEIGMLVRKLDSDGGRINTIRVTLWESTRHHVIV